MSSDVQRFAESFRNEAELRERLATLFSKFSNIQGVEVPHGPQEYGKDIVFYSQDAIGDWILNACVVKNAKITGAAEGEDSARNVFNQVEQALDTAFINKSGDQENVSHVYIISPYDCPQTTMRSIEGKLRERSGQVTFLCGRLLLEKFAKYWPEFVAFETTLIASYIARLQHAFAEADPIAFLTGQHQVLSAGSQGLTKVYVPQRFRKSLQEFELSLSLPPRNYLAGEISETTVADFTKNILSIAALLRHPEAWDAAKRREAQPTSAELMSAAEEIRASWNAECDRARSERQRRGLRVPPKSEIRVALKLDLRLIEGLLSRVGEALESLRKRLSEANTFAATCRHILPELGSPAHLHYCATNQIVQLSPTAFRPRSACREEFLNEDLLTKTNVPLLISAPAGYGKTSFCKWHFLDDVQLLTSSKSTTIPVYIPLHQLATASITTVDDVFLRSEDLKQLVQFARQEGRAIRFYLDGLDEVSTSEQQRKLMELASQIPKGFPNCQVLVTSRDYVTGPWLHWLARVGLAEFTSAQVQQFMLNWLGKDSDELKKFADELEKARTLSPLMHVPLLATLIIAVFKKMHSLPENKLGLYEIFVDLMCGGWDIAKNVRRSTKFGSNAKLSILTRLAGHLHLNERREAEESDIRSVVNECFPAAYDDWRTVLGELLEDGLLVRLAGGLGFSHLSFQEYLAARDLTTDPTGERQKLVLRRFLRGEDWWREVLAFYLSMTQRPDEAAGWIKSVGIKISRDLRSQDIAHRWEFMMKCLQEAAPGWKAPEPGPLIRI